MFRRMLLWWVMLVTLQPPLFFRQMRSLDSLTTRDPMAGFEPAYLTLFLYQLRT